MLRMNLYTQLYYSFIQIVYVSDSFAVQTFFRCLEYMQASNSSSLCPLKYGIKAIMDLFKYQ